MEPGSRYSHISCEAMCISTLQECGVGQVQTFLMELVFIALQDAHSMRSTPCGCRTGGVVHLLPASGAKIPVTVKLSTKEVTATGHTHHIVEVPLMQTKAVQLQM